MCVWTFIHTCIEIHMCVYFYISICIYLFVYVCLNGPWARPLKACRRRIDRFRAPLWRIVGPVISKGGHEVLCKDCMGVLVEDPCSSGLPQTFRLAPPTFKSSLGHDIHSVLERVEEEACYYRGLTSCYGPYVPVYSYGYVIIYLNTWTQIGPLTGPSMALHGPPGLPGLLWTLETTGAINFSKSPQHQFWYCWW